MEKIYLNILADICDLCYTLGACGCELWSEGKRKVVTQPLKWGRPPGGRENLREDVFPLDMSYLPFTIAL